MASAAAAAITRLPVLSIQVHCDAGVFDFHRIAGDSLLLALDDVIWRLAPEPRPSTAEGEVWAMLAEHMTDDMGFSVETVAAKLRFLSPALVDLIDGYFSQPSSDDLPLPINGDPFTHSQEYPFSFRVDAVEVAADAATVNVVFSDDHRERPVQIHLRLAGGRWLVDDLGYEDGATFRNLLMQLRD